MKLIIKEYLSSLREREELDAILPDLLSQMGLNVFISPSRGVKEYGVDIAAVGKLEDAKEKVYLFSVKSGNLTRETWDGASAQSLRPSLNQILDAFIPSRIPSKHQDKVIEICLCFGGDIHSGIRQEVSGYTNSHSTESISFSEWNGDKLAEYIERYFLREDLAPPNVRSHLRKTLAMIDEPEISFKHFQVLVDTVRNGSFKRQKDKVTALRQILIYNWILYAWCREEDNIECAYLACERALLIGWEFIKPFIGKKTKVAKDAFHALDALLSLYLEVSNQYIGKVVAPHCGNLHALSAAGSPSCHVDVNLKLFDLIGRTALCGIWTYWRWQSVSIDDLDAKKYFLKVYNTIKEYIIKTIINNPILFTPYKDDQAIDIVLTIWFLSLDQENLTNIEGWMSRIVGASYNALECHKKYPANLYNYSDLIEHPRLSTDKYRESVTQGTILFPYLSLFAAIFGQSQIYGDIGKIKGELLGHSNFQVYFFDENTEEHLYTNNRTHGATLSHVSVDKDPIEYISEIVKECGHSNHFKSLSAVRCNFFPIVLVACRHYRLPFPAHLIIDIHTQLNSTSKNEVGNEPSNEGKGDSE